MTATQMPRIAYLTAGAAGMYCGSCLHDNTLVAALRRQSIDATLIPTYTPIRTDEEDVSANQVFFGGINVYLQQKFGFFRYLPRFLDRWLDRPGLIRWLARDATGPGPEALGQLTVSMLQGPQGHQAKEVERLVDWLETDFRPQLIGLTNILIGGCIPTLKQRLKVPIVVTLQGDDVFLDYLPPRYREESIRWIRQVAEHVDGFLVYSQFYADYMRGYLGLENARFDIVPLGIQTADFQAGIAERPADRPPTVGYFARLAPEKGLHTLVDAFIRLRSNWNETGPAPRLLMAGWLGKQHQAYADEQFQRLDRAGLEGEYRYWGSVDREQKLRFLQELDVFSVPTKFYEPKGLYVLEALAAGVPVVQPAHGIFPEILASTGGGRLFTPHDAGELARELQRLLQDREAAAALGREGRAAVLQKHNADAMARSTMELYRQFIR